jgi:hypothetical protein
MFARTADFQVSGGAWQRRRVGVRASLDLVQPVFEPSGP